MKKLALASMVLVTLGMASVAGAQTVAGSGTVNFEGSIVDDSCILLVEGSQNNGGSHLVLMNDVSKFALGTEDAPKAGKMTQVGANVDLTLECTGPQDLSVTFAAGPAGVSGKSLAVQGGAQNGQLTLLRSDDSVLDFSTGTAEITGIDYVGGKFTLPMTAYYTLADGKAAADVVSGVANSSMTYTISYQ